MTSVLSMGFTVHNMQASVCESRTRPL